MGVFGEIEQQTPPSPLWGGLGRGKPQTPRPRHPHPCPHPARGRETYRLDHAPTSPPPLRGRDRVGGKPQTRSLPSPSPPYRAPSPRRGEVFAVSWLPAKGGADRGCGPLRAPATGSKHLPLAGEAGRGVSHNTRALAPPPSIPPHKGREAVWHAQATTSPFPLWGGNKGGGKPQTRSRPVPLTALPATLSPTGRWFSPLHRPRLKSPTRATTTHFLRPLGEKVARSAG